MRGDRKRGGGGVREGTGAAAQGRVDLGEDFLVPETKEIRAQRGTATCSKSHRNKESRLKPDCLTPKSGLLTLPCPL